MGLQINTNVAVLAVSRVLQHSPVDAEIARRRSGGEEPAPEFPARLEFELVSRSGGTETGALREPQAAQRELAAARRQLLEDRPGGVAAQGHVTPTTAADLLYE